jgi:DNA gyrase subunit A
MEVGGISRIGRATQGVRVIQVEEDDVVVSAIRTAEPEQREAKKTTGNGGNATDPDGVEEPGEAAPPEAIEAEGPAGDSGEES